MFILVRLTGSDVLEDLRILNVANDRPDSRRLIELQRLLIRKGSKRILLAQSIWIRPTLHGVDTRDSIMLDTIKRNLGDVSRLVVIGELVELHTSISPSLMLDGE